jgi:hypothetical protein
VSNPASRFIILGMYALQSPLSDFQRYGLEKLPDRPDAEVAFRAVAHGNGVRIGFLLADD